MLGTLRFWHWVSFSYVQTLQIVSLLSESYNPHVRHSPALMFGISCAGTGPSEAISLLEPLTSDVPAIPLLMHSDSWCCRKEIRTGAL
ncbi:26S proteasome non-ATPase regulatory subunit 1 homolog B-like isoform X1 [Coffea arabica]|uniref:26S proteasome non-ATPase regulatory subunit 1 homolog B-like isoform X1 n=1 Tax=Coffea arabica TaxID=13443 RepID=A0ABM4X6N8_COFAR